MAGEPNITPHNGDRRGGGVRQNRKAAAFMLVSVLVFSFIPLAIVRGGGIESPFLFNAGWRFGVAAGCLLFLLAFYRPLLLSKSFWAAAGVGAVSWPAFWSLFVNLDYALFSTSARFVDVSISAVLFELWPILMIVIIARLLPDEGYRKNLRGILPFLTVAFIGLYFVVASQTGGLQFGAGTSSRLWAIGILLALLSAVAGSLGGITFRWGRDLAERLLAESTVGYDRTSLYLFGSIAGFAGVNLFGSGLSWGIGFAFGENIGAAALLSAVAWGLILHVAAVTSHRKSILSTDNLGINALAYLIPILSLAWLWLFGEIGVARLDYLAIGTSAIVVTNLLINFEAERLRGFKALVISLWACGTLVYLRDKASWGWTAQADGYFDILFLSATVFALILSFRTVRLASRTQEEDNRAFRLFRELEELERRGVILRWGDAAAFEHILTIDQEQGWELERAYTTARRALNDALPQTNGPEREKLLTLSTELDRLAHSRQQGINFGEICALFIFAGLVVGTALLSRPAAVSGLTGFLVEMFAMLFPAVIIFLACNVLDLQRDRVSRILKKSPEYGGYGVAFQDTVSQAERVEHTSRRTVEQGISIGVGGALIVAYAGLFLHKWGLWEQLMAAAAGFLP